MRRRWDPLFVGARRAAAIIQKSRAFATASADPFDRLLPSVRRLLALEHISPTEVTGTGPKQRILKGDVLDYIARGKLKRSAAPPQPIATTVSPPTMPSAGTKMATPIPPIPSATGSFTDIPASNMRKVIAQRLLESKTTIPHFYVSAEADITAVERMREAFRTKETKLSVNDVIIKAAALALRTHPQLNANWNAGTNAVRLLRTVDISVAVAVSNGLVTPVIRNADVKPLAAISEEMRSLVAKAREGKLRPDEYIGGSFSISNLGMFGIDSFVAVINPPQIANLAVGTARRRPVQRIATGGEDTIDQAADSVARDSLEIATYVSLTLSADARAIDEPSANEFMQTLKGFMESPESMLS